MVVGTLQFELLIHDAESLKDKRRVVRSLKDRLHREHMVSCAEVAEHDNPCRAVMGLAAVAGDGKRAAEILDRISAKLLAMTAAEAGSIERALIHRDELQAVDHPAANADTGELADEMLDRFMRDGGGNA